MPVSFVELGVLDGYSTINIAKGIQWLHKYRGYQRQLDSYDLFDDYNFKHGELSEVQSRLKAEGLSDYVNLRKGDAYKVHENYPDMVFDEVKGIEFLHIDISNHGKSIHDLMELWHPKIGVRGIVLIEGGSKERDEVGWMSKYDMPSIRKELASNPLINKFYDYGTYLDYPGLTVLLRHWWKQ